MAKGCEDQATSVAHRLPYWIPFSVRHAYTNNLAVCHIVPFAAAVALRLN